MNPARGAGRFRCVLGVRLCGRRRNRARLFPSQLKVGAQFVANPFHEILDAQSRLVLLHPEPVQIVTDLGRGRLEPLEEFATVFKGRVRLRRFVPEEDEFVDTVLAATRCRLMGLGGLGPAFAGVAAARLALREFAPRFVNP